MALPVGVGSAFANGSGKCVCQWEFDLRELPVEEFVSGRRLGKCVCQWDQLKSLFRVGGWGSAFANGSLI
jgi:hypothetical protein